MRLLATILAAALVLPLLLLAAVALGPVTLVFISAVGFGLVVFAIFNIPVVLGVLGRALQRAGVHHSHHVSPPRMHA